MGDGRPQPREAGGVRDAIGAPVDSPLIAADAGDPASLQAMIDQTKSVLTTVGPYQLYGSELVAACAAMARTISISAASRCGCGR